METQLQRMSIVPRSFGEPTQAERTGKLTKLLFLKELVANPWKCGLLAYCALVRSLRYQRRDNTQRRSRYKSREDYASMTIRDAHEIQLALAELEFPRVFSGSVFFALFKTYGIPTISSLLVSTGQSASETTASKRAADTGIILTEMVLNTPTSKRAVDGIARMNYLHDRYRRAGKISDADMLYKLSLFGLEPIRWTNKYEWRTLTDFERSATGVFRKNMGEAMEIPYELLLGSKQGWRDGLAWLDDLERWSLQYEEEFMVPAESNHQLALGTLDLALFKLPAAWHGVGRQFVAALLDPRLRKAMM